MAAIMRYREGKEMGMGVFFLKHKHIYLHVHVSCDIPMGFYLTVCLSRSAASGLDKLWMYTGLRVQSSELVVDTACVL